MNIFIFGVKILCYVYNFMFSCFYLKNYVKWCNVFWLVNEEIWRSKVWFLVVVWEMYELVLCRDWGYVVDIMFWLLFLFFVVGFVGFWILVDWFVL